jgi:hypothetical protein
MVAVGTPTGRIARSAQVVAYAFVMAVLGVLSWRTTSLKLPDVGQFAGIIGSGVLGGIINPVKATVGAAAPAAAAVPAARAVAAVGGPTSARGAEGDQGDQGSQAGQGAQAAQGLATPAATATAYDLPWVGAVLIGSAAIIVCALALAVHSPSHPNAAPALTALATAFGTLFIDTSSLTHVPDNPGPGADGGDS